jgi:RNA polymerase sigma-70 factor, ECF subfamily
MNKQLSVLSDEDLMDLVQQEHHPAFSELVTRHTSRFYALAYRTLSDKVASEDIVQEAFLKLWRDPSRWQVGRGAKFTTWFYQITLNLCLDHNKKKKPLPLSEGFDVQDETSGLETRLGENQQQHLMDKAISELPETQRTALNLCFYERVSNQQAADIMGLSLKALQSLLIRAKTSLRDRVRSTIKRAG